MNESTSNGPGSGTAAPGGGGDAASAPGPAYRGPGVVETEAPRSGFLPVLLRFFVVPLVLVAASLGVFAALGAVVGRGAPTSDDLVAGIAGGGKNSRWQAAQDLANQVARGEVDLHADEALARTVAAAFARARAEGDDPRVLQMFAVLLGRSPAPLARPVLEEALADGDPDVRIFVLGALAELGDAASLGPVADRAADLDPGVRTMAAYSLAVLLEKAGKAAAGAEAAAAVLVKALGDPAVDVRWNAALGLARLRRTEGADLLWQMLHRDYVRANLATGDGAGGFRALFAPGGRDPATPGEVEERVVLNALSAVFRLRDRSMIGGVAALAEVDPSAPVKDWALRAKAAIEDEIRERGPVDPRTWTAAR